MFLVNLGGHVPKKRPLRMRIRSARIKKKNLDVFLDPRMVMSSSFRALGRCCNSLCYTNCFCLLSSLPCIRGFLISLFFFY